MDITIAISLEAAQALQHLAAPNAASLAVQAIAQDLGVKLQPVHPGIQDIELVKYFFTQAVSEQQAQSIIDTFLTCPSVEGAYVKPEGEPP
jgi:hypothetical protein